jgi:hypothetical protein
MKIRSLLLLLLIKGGILCAADIAQLMPPPGILIDTMPDKQTNLASAATSQWAFLDASGKLTYKTTDRGDKIMDFSQAGYGGGGVAIPIPPVKITLSPSPGDNTDAIQQAIDVVSKMKPQNGFRGAVLLKPGIYTCERPLTITTSGVVLRGSGPGEKGTVIQLAGNPHTAIIVKGKITYTEKGERTVITDSYVPSGSSSFTLADAAGFSVGDMIRITRPVTEAWIKFMGMNELVRNGKKQTWLNGVITVDRIIRKLEKNKVTVDLPLTDSYDRQYLDPPGVSVVKIASEGELSQIGIENFRITSPEQTGTINEHHHNAFNLSGLVDGWAKDIEIFNTVNSIGVTGRRITIDNVSIIHNLPTTGAAKPADLNGSGSQLLFNHCSIQGDNVFFFATGAKVSGPIVLLNCTFRGNGWIQPHQRWATGLLVDNCNVPDGGIDFMNRGEMGSGHGWAIGWAVAWNCKAKSYLNQLPPGSVNWVIGCQGTPQKRAIPFETQPLLPEGLYDSHGVPVTPASLYLQQLSDRLGRQALKNIGYE